MYVTPIFTEQDTNDGAVSTLKIHWELAWVFYFKAICIKSKICDIIEVAC
jgi:hypothetical protein